MTALVSIKDPFWAVMYIVYIVMADGMFTRSFELLEWDIDQGKVNHYGSFRIVFILKHVNFLQRLWLHLF